MNVTECYRPTNVSAAGKVKAVVRVMSISTKYEHQQQRNVSLFCVFNYDDDRHPATVSNMLLPPSVTGLFLIIVIFFFYQI